LNVAIDQPAKLIALVGDSTFDNARYVRGAPDVISAFCANCSHPVAMRNSWPSTAA